MSWYHMGVRTHLATVIKFAPCGVLRRTRRPEKRPCGPKGLVHHSEKYRILNSVFSVVLGFFFSSIYFEIYKWRHMSLES